MYKVKIEYDFFDDLNNISEYIFRSTFSKTITKNLSNEILKTLLVLNLFPLMYELKYKNFRCITIKSYSIFYIVNENKKEVYVYRIFWQSQDFKEYI